MMKASSRVPVTIIGVDSTRRPMRLAGKLAGRASRLRCVELDDPGDVDDDRPQQDRAHRPDDDSVRQERLAEVRSQSAYQSTRASPRRARRASSGCRACGGSGSRPGSRRSRRRSSSCRSSSATSQPLRSPGPEVMLGMDWRGDDTVVNLMGWRTSAAAPFLALARLIQGNLIGIERTGQSRAVTRSSSTSPPSLVSSITT